MAYAGQVIENPVSGERITFVTTGADGDGEPLVIDLELAPDRHAPGMHVHPLQQERFELISRRMRFRQGMRHSVAEPGDVVVVEPGTVHAFTNAGEGPARARVEIRPALQMERLFETAVALGREDRTNARGMPTPMEPALLTREFAPGGAGSVRPRVAAPRVHSLPAEDDAGTCRFDAPATLVGNRSTNRTSGPGGADAVALGGSRASGACRPRR